MITPEEAAILEEYTMKDLGHWQNIRLNAFPFPNFSPYELRQRENGIVKVSLFFLEKLEQLRVSYGKPMIITSYYRSPAYNAEMSATKSLSGPHTTGRAVDVRIDRGDAFELTKLAMNQGFTGVGWSQKGRVRFVHLDDLDDAPGQPRPTVWSY